MNWRHPYWRAAPHGESASANATGIQTHVVAGAVGALDGDATGLVHHGLVVGTEDNGRTNHGAGSHH